MDVTEPTTEVQDRKKSQLRAALQAPAQGTCHFGDFHRPHWRTWAFSAKFYRSRSDKSMHAEYFRLNSAWPSPAPCLRRALWKQPFEVREIWVIDFNRNSEQGGDAQLLHLSLLPSVTVLPGDGLFYSLLVGALLSPVKLMPTSKNQTAWACKNSYF